MPKSRITRSFTANGSQRRSSHELPLHEGPAGLLWSLHATASHGCVALAWQLFVRIVRDLRHGHSDRSPGENGGSDGMDDLLGFIGDPDLDLDGEQESKTLRALESLVSY